MYFSISIVIFALLLVFVFATGRRRNAMKKVCSMTCQEKCRLLDDLLAPFGYCYLECQDIISTRIDAWQRNMGYTALFDRAASHFNMVLDSLAVYFPYRDKTWLIEFWKGQYGINTGAEVGIYHSDQLLADEELRIALFQAADDQEMLPLSFELAGKCPLASVAKTTWWLTAFCMGQFSDPGELSMNISIRFPDCEMRCSFVNALHHAGMSKDHIRVCGNMVHISFCGAQGKKYGFFERLSRRLSQFSNRLFCRVFLLITMPFTTTLDRLLYLYFLLPFAFRRTITPRRYRRRRRG